MCAHACACIHRRMQHFWCLRCVCSQLQHVSKPKMHIRVGLLISLSLSQPSLHASCSRKENKICSVVPICCHQLLNIFCSLLSFYYWYLSGYIVFDPKQVFNIYSWKTECYDSVIMSDGSMCITGLPSDPWKLQCTRKLYFKKP